jgi:hypothetical protein
MKAFMRSLKLFSGILAVAALGGCLTGGDSDQDPTKFLDNFEADVVDIDPPDSDEGEPGLIKTAGTYFYCEDGELVEEAFQEDFNYALTNGSLYLWEEDDCTAMKLSGSSSTVIGKWTSENLSTRIPSAYRPYDCEGEDPEDNEYEYFLEDASVTHTISSSKIKTKVTGTLCFAPLFAMEFSYVGDVTTVSSTCETVELKNGDDQTATLTAKFTKDALVETIVYNGETCQLTYASSSDDEASTCSEESDNEFEDAYDEFRDCLDETGFTDGFPGLGYSEKRAGKLPSNVVKALRLIRPR